MIKETQKDRMNECFETCFKKVLYIQKILVEELEMQNASIVQCLMSKHCTR